MARFGLPLILVALAAIIALCFAAPQAMLAPGPVMPAHAAIAGDCFACHAPLRGAVAARCITCHAPARIGRFATTGAALPAGKAAFHQQLTEPDCLACHSDHAGPALTGHSPVGFRHALLQPAIRGDCRACHTAPTGRRAPLHKAVAGAACSECHGTDRWQPARFRHELLASATAARCATCHQPPGDAMHRGIGTLSCARCHTITAWEPATFDHDRLFRLDGDHAAPCATCHVGGDLARYTCYGCHAHDPVRVRAEHRDEGIGGNIDKCVRCHRGGEGEGEGGGEREGEDDR